MAHAQKSDLVFQRNGRVHLNCRGGGSVQSTTGSRGVRISGSNGSNAGYTMFWGRVQDPLHSHVPPSLPLPCVTVCHQVSSELYHISFHDSKESSRGVAPASQLRTFAILSLFTVGPSVPPSVHMYYLGSHWTEIQENIKCRHALKPVKKTQDRLKTANNIRHSSLSTFTGVTHWPLQGMRKLSRKIVEKSKAYLIFNIFLTKFVSLRHNYNKAEHVTDDVTQYDEKTSFAFRAIKINFQTKTKGCNILHLQFPLDYGWRLRWILNYKSLS